MVRVHDGLFRRFRLSSAGALSVACAMVLAVGVTCTPGPAAQENPDAEGNLAVTVIPDVGRPNRFPHKQATWNLIDASTAEARNRHLSREGILALGGNDMLFVRWPAPRRFSIQTKDLPMSVFVAPIRIGEGNVASGEFAELWPHERPNRTAPGVSSADCEPIDDRRPWASYGYMRPWDFDSPEAVIGFVLVRGRAIYGLNLPTTNTVFEMPAAGLTFTVPAAVMEKPAEPDPTSVTVDFTVTGQSTPISVAVQPLVTNAARYAGLESAAKLAPVDSREAATTAGGFLVAFDRADSRPYFTGKLSPPFDMGVFDEADRLVRVVSVAEGAPLDWPTFSLDDYRYLLLMPKGWFAAMGLLEAADGFTVAAGPLTVPASLTRLPPEPARYEIKVGGHRVWVEVVYSTPERNRGLMWRRQLPPDSGMLFLYPRAQDRGFWMMCCFFDQSIAYIFPNWQIASIRDMLHPVTPAQAATADANRPRSKDDLVRESREHYNSDADVSFCLELPIGWYRAHGVGPAADIDPGPVVRQLVRRAE